MEMGEQFEKRLLMHRNARKLDEETNRQLLQLCNEQDLLGRFVQASMHKELAMEHQMGRALTAKDPAYKRLLEKAVAVDEQIEQEAARLEQLSTLKFKDRNPNISGGDPDEQQILGENDDAPKPRKPVRSKSRPQRDGQIWLESWNNGIETTTERSKDPPTVDLFLETTEAMLMKTEVECFDLILIA
jgi:hypothetical protein